MSEILNKEIKYSGKFLQMENISFKNDNGKVLSWEACQRKNNVNAVSIITILIPSHELILIREFRAPVGKYCIGNPAGIIENGEDIVDTAIRELKEETGYIVTKEDIIKIGEASESSAGLTGELTNTVIAFVKEENNLHPIQTLEDSECIEVIKVKIDKLKEFIDEKIKEDNVFSSKIMNFYAGLLYSGIYFIHH